MGVSDAAIHRVRQKVAAGFSALRLGIVNCVFLKVCYTLDYDATEHCTSFMRDAVLLDDFKAVFPAWYRIHLYLIRYAIESALCLSYSQEYKAAV